MAARRPAAPPTNAAPAAGPAVARRVGRPSNERFRQLFTRNLNQLLDARPDVPREASGRAAELARVCAVTPAAARKWLTGAGWPTLEKLLELAQRYGFAPDDLLADGPRQVVDISRLIDAQALRRAELGELTPVPALAGGAARLQLAIDPAIFAGRDAAGAAMALVEVADDTLAPHLAAGDQVVVKLDARWHGDGIYLLQATPTAPPALRRVHRVEDGYRIVDAHGSTMAAALAIDEAGALDGSPILRGMPLCLLRNLGRDSR
jgi:transcriptional regulator with XRE-family HTH domain